MVSTGESRWTIATPTPVPSCGRKRASPSASDGAGHPFSKIGLENKSAPTATDDELMAFVRPCDENGRASLAQAALAPWVCLASSTSSPRARSSIAVQRTLRTRFWSCTRGPEEVWLPLVARPVPCSVPSGHAPGQDPAGADLGPDAGADWVEEAAGVPVPRVTDSGDLSYMGHGATRLISLAGPPDELSTTLFRHGGLAEMGDGDPTGAQMRATSRHKSAKTLPIRETHAETPHRRHQEAALGANESR